MLPPLFQMDNYDECIKNQRKYCKADAVLEIPSHNRKLLQYITELMLDERLDRSVVHRAICLPTAELSDNQPIELQLSKIIDKQLETYNLTTKVDYHVCTNGETAVTEFDKFILVILVAYLILVLIATYITARKKLFLKGNGSILSDLSLLESWKKRTTTSNNEDYQKLLSIQGIRVLLMSFIICTHVIVDYCFVYLDHPEPFEQPITAIAALPYISPFFILCYFIISSWLSTLQVYNIFQKHGAFSLKHVGIIIINRYFRLISTLFVLLVWRTNWIRRIEGPLNFDLINFNLNACKNHWLQKLLFFSNFNLFVDVCSPYSWSLSADFQLYVINTLILYLIFKFKLNEFRILGMVLALFCVIHCSVLYYYEMSVFIVSIKTMEYRRLRFDKEIVFLYFSTVAIASSSCIGMIMGAIYYKTKKIKLERKMIYPLLLIALSIGLPTISVILSMIKFERLGGAIMGSIIKPIFSLGIGIGILGMRYKLGGKVKKFLENKYFVFLSNFSYCIYLSQEFMILYKHRISPPNVNASTVIGDILAVYPATVVLGIFLTLVIEEPFYSLQKKILPQIKHNEQELKNKIK